MSESAKNPHPPQRATSYRGIRWQRAIGETKEFIGRDIRLEVAIALAGAVVGAVVRLYTGEPKELNVLLSSLFLGLAVLGVVVLVHFLISFFTVPARMYEEDRTKIAELEEMREQHIEGLRSDFFQTFHDYADARGDLWSILDFASARRQETEVDHGLVRECMKRVEFPEDILGIGQNEQLYDYAKNAVEEWGDGRREFLDFCLLLYRQDGSSPLNRYERTSLDVYRRDLSKFWEEWGRRCSRQNMSIGDIAPPDIIQGQTPDVVMLTYLEIARGLHKKENSRGKQGLFRVAKDFREFSNS